MAVRRRHCSGADIAAGGTLAEVRADHVLIDR